MMNRLLPYGTASTSLLAVLLLYAASAGNLLAQTGPQLLLKPFPQERKLETDGSAIFFADGETEEDDADFGLTVYEMAGRVRLFPGERADPRAGWDLYYLNIDSDTPALPNTLIDQSVGFGMGVANVQGWLAGITVGVGYAGDNAYSDANAWYYMATLAAGKELDETSALGLVIDYNGNRSFMPDVPLPGFQYRKRIDPTMMLALGFPVSSLEWTPDDRWSVEVTYAIPDRFEGQVRYELFRNVRAFASYFSRTEAFFLDDLPDNRRLIFEQRRAEVGLRWDPVEQASLVLAGGYAFSQEFNVGWDTRDAPNLAEPSDEPYLRVGFEARF